MSLVIRQRQLNINMARSVRHTSLEHLQATKTHVNLRIGIAYLGRSGISKFSPYKHALNSFNVCVPLDISTLVEMAIFTYCIT